jgi:aryl-alcohol dehydrogenase-like predicted oxidoreductase
MSITKLGLGLAALGRPEYINIRDNKNIDKSYESFEQNAYEMLDFAYENGIRYFDTAPSYGKGELFLKNWNDKYVYNNISLSTKWGYTYVANWEIGYTGKHEIKEHSIEKLTQQWQDSKALLPNLKIYQIHSATLESGVLKNEAVLNELYRLKKEHNLKIGLSSSGINQSEIIEKALKTEINNEILFDSFQVTFNFLEQATFSTLKKAKKLGKTIIIKEALANGRIFSYKNETLKKLSKKYNVGIDALALRFVIDYLAPDYLLSGASSKKQLTENLKSLNFSFSIDEIEQLKNLRVDSKTYWEERSNLNWD